MKNMVLTSYVLCIFADPRPVCFDFNFLIFLGVCSHIEVTDGSLRDQAATVDCGPRPQHPCGHRNHYSRPEAVIVPCARRAQVSLSLS